MEEDDTLTMLQGLQADLVAFSEARLANLERLWAELEGSISDFRKLLEKQQRNDKSRQALKGNTVTIDDVEYSINNEFREDVIQVADELDLDELEAAKLYLQSRDTAVEIDRPVSLAAIFRFHGQRETLLHALRLSIQQSGELDLEPEHREVFGQVARLVTQGEQPNSGWKFFRKCIVSMGEIEEWLRKIQDRLQSASVIGQSVMGYALEALEFERDSLLKQHESLGAILSGLAKEGHAQIHDYQFLMSKTSVLDKVDSIVLHYVPALISLASAFGPLDSTTTITDARGLDQTFSDTTNNSRWKLTEFRAAASAFWLAEYSSRYIEPPVDDSLRGVDLEAESETRSKRLMDSIQNGALEFILLLCSQIRAEEWHDPAKADLVAFLLRGVESQRNSALHASDYFQELLSQSLQLFSDAFISNMPDTIRRLKFEEDEQRRNMSTRAPHGGSQYSLHLERFLLIISYAFQGFPDAAQSFWSDPDGNLYGFLQWASKRQSTPRAATFCEMFRSIAEDQECADAAHKFLLEDATTTSAKLRRGAPLSWVQIFNELSFYAPGPTEKTAELSVPIVEPESELMLECYLRLIAHMCRKSENARMFILGHPTVHLHEILLELAARSNVTTRLRACIYSCIAALLTDKIGEASNSMWEVLDSWLHGIPVAPAKPGTQKVQSPSNPSMEGKARLEAIAMGFDEPNAFTRLLHVMVSPSAEQTDLGDLLPFPEQLGTQYRMPGIEEYVDFVLDRVFAKKTLDLMETNQIWELRCTCLDFIVTCLSTFNEDLVIFANSTNLPVDSVISTSTLAAYVRLHPFARVMEWLFNDGVAAALFAAAHEEIVTVASAAPGSPRVVALCRSIQVINLVLKLQSTYFDIVRPVIKLQSQGRERTIANPALASFEDVILNHVNLIVDLGLYCGTGHQDLTMLSLHLLQSLATARKLSISSGAAHAGSRVLAALQQDYDVDRIALGFIAPLQLDPRELEMGELGPGIAIKQAILDLLNTSLEMSSNRPALAHCLLGFTCGERTVSVPPEGLFSRGGSLFHAVAKLSADTISLGQSNSLAWLSAIRRTSCQIIHKLVRSPLTERLVLDDLRESGYADAVAVTQQSISPDTLWCGRTCADPEFLSSDSAPVFRDFLVQRTAFFEHASLEIRSTVQRNSPTLRQKIVASLLGITTIASGEQIQHASIFEMFDFIDLDVALPFQMTERKFVGSIDFSICRTENPDRGTVYDLRLVKELLLLKEAELHKSGQLTDSAAAQQCSAEADAVMLCFQSENQYAAGLAGQRSALNAWVQLVALMLAMGDFEPAPKTALVLQALQIVLPKLDKTLIEDSPVTLPLARLTYNLVRVADTSAAAASTRDGNAANDRLTHAFRTALRGVASATGTGELRETCYQIIRHFLKEVVLPAGNAAPMLRQSAKTIEHGGERLVDTICEDALSSQGTCRISALLAIEVSIQLFQGAKSSYIIRSLSRLNFISVLVDSIRAIAAEFSEQRAGQDLTTLLSYVHTGLAVLLRASQSNDGATAILESGLFSAIRDSQLFATDPDIGLDVDNAEALENFYRLLTSLLRVIVSVVITKGPRNQQIIAQARQFLNDNRQCMQGVFKAANRGEKLSTEGRKALEELVDGFTVLISASGFLEVDEQPTGPKTTSQMFT
ncbi:hypothetical protein AAFC00_002780 [Neodothiora populina]|uniref:Nuclear pore complex subunit Nup192 n=1 Tax=Neodothiora populina TaxID=2781224 RepID=A0ABR3P8I3_9PEZI